MNLIRISVEIPFFWKPSAHYSDSFNMKRIWVYWLWFTFHFKEEGIIEITAETLGDA